MPTTRIFPALVTALLPVVAGPAAAQDCRLALVLALDVSGSVDVVELHLMREGLGQALLAPEVVRAFLSGEPVALYVFEWAGQNWQRPVIAEWQMIEQEEDLVRISYQRPPISTLGFAGVGCGDSLRAGAWREAVMPTGRPVEITRTELTASDLRRAAAWSREADAARRMLAIALVLEGKSRKEAAESCGMDRQTLRDWVVRYNEGGLAGLSDRVPPGRSCRLSPEQMADLSEIVEEGPDLAVDHVVRWRRVDLRRVIRERWGVEFHERTVGKLLHRLGFARLSVRPKHPKSDPAAQAEWGKKLQPAREGRPAGERPRQAH